MHILDERQTLMKLAERQPVNIGPLRWLVADASSFPQMVSGTSEGKLHCTCGAIGICMHIGKVREMLAGLSK